MMDKINYEIDFYCLNFMSNPIRRKNMNQKSIYFQIPINYYSGVTTTDPRISFIKDANRLRAASICYGHLDIMQHFIDHSTKEFLLVMEDDIIIRKSLIEDINKIIDIVKQDHYDLFLLGYLCSNPIDTYSNFIQIHTKYSTDEFKVIDNYPKNTWGAQMYIITRKQCKVLLEKYSTGYLEKSLNDSGMIPFSADWIITKEGKYGLVYPPRAAESYIENQYEDEYQNLSRYNCNEFIQKERYI